MHIAAALTEVHASAASASVRLAEPQRSIMAFRNAQQPGGNNAGDYDDADYEDDEEYVDEDEEVDETDEDEEDDEEYDGQIEEGEDNFALASSSCQYDPAKNFCSDLVNTEYTLGTHCS